ncbi:MAG TPA: ATP-dependent RNA helicase HrpA, partial [Phycisphaerales bacterium]|nr:ATP-dependent RNA helicase HrpA [Phycisphaerales bacterium]
EVRYRPLASDDPDELDRTQEQAVLDAVDELARSGPGQPGDVLVFLPGEREIRETAEALRKHHPPGTEILPLYARLSAEEQLRVFKPRASGVQRRIVLATNVAETSLTVPGIRAVIDTGLARISRYSPRTRVQRLPIEPVSRASADQRAGRCGRVAPGVCIRLYSEEDYAQRPPFTDPEVLRTNLASVILQMKALRLGDVGAFPFIDPPDSRLVRDGYETLLELGAVDEAGDLTSLGAKLARLPVDPRLGRMILAAAAEGCLGEMLVLAAALSVPDPRERPLEQREPADAAHAPFRDETSDFLGLLKLWAWHEEQSAKLSSSQLRRVCRQTFLSFMRLREWHDVYQQLRVLATDMGFRVEDRPCGPEPLHRALLPGLVSSVGARRETGEYAGPRGLRFWIHPGSGLHKKGPRWVVAAELVTTTRLYARTVGRVEPAWIERAAPHLVRRSHHDPHYDERSQSAVVLETVTLFGLELARGRRVCLAPLDPVLARELFIRHALVEGRLRTAAPFLELNRRAEEAVRRLEHKLRRPGLLAGPEARHDFFDRRLPPEVHSASTFESWRARAERARRDLLVMTERDLLAAPVPADVDELYPDELAVGTARFPLRYRAEPGHPDDGVTVELPLEAIGQLDESLAQWLVPGMLREKTVELIRALPKAVRVSFVPAPQTAERVLPALVRRARAEPRPSLAEALALELSALPGGVLVDPSMLREEALPPHLRLHIRVLGSQGQTLAGGRDVGAVKRAVSVRLAEALAAVPDPRWNRAGVASWDFGDLPERVVLERHGLRFESFPALIDLGTTAGLRLFRSAPEARHAMRAGLRRLLALELAPELEFQLRHQPGLPALCLMYAPLGSCQTLRAHLAAHIAERACLARGPGQDPVPAHEVRSQARFAELAAAGWHRVAHVAHEATDDVRVILTSLTGLRAALEGPLAAAPAAAESLADIRSQLDHLVPRDFLLSTPPQWLAQLPRFLLGVQRRLEKLAAGQAERDAARMPEVVPLWRAYLARAAERRAQGIPEDDDLQRFRWLLEELRISVFAQELRTSQPVSPQRLHKLWMSL